VFHDRTLSILRIPAVWKSISESSEKIKKFCRLSIGGVEG
jgi:hypothetical protein